MVDLLEEADDHYLLRWLRGNLPVLFFIEIFVNILKGISMILSAKAFIFDF